MKGFCFLIVLMLLSSCAHAGNTFSFVVGGHRIRVEAPRHCHSPSCVSVSIPGIYQSRRWRDRLDEDDRDVTEPVKTPAAVQPPIQVVPPPGNPAVVAAPPPAVFKPATAAGRSRPATGGSSAAGVQRFASGGDEPADTPVGDWQSEGSNGAIRIERCGRALCGYALKSSSSDKGEAVLVNMKPNPARNGPATSTATTAAIPITARWYRRVRTRCGSKPVRSDGFIVPATIGAGSAASRRS